MHLALLIFVDLLLVGAGIWDAVILKRKGIDSGWTISWLLYEDSKNYPVIALVFGSLLAWTVIAFSVPLPVAVFIFTCGHIFATMRGA